MLERPADGDVSVLLDEAESEPIDGNDPQLGEAMRTRRLQWSAVD